jgi:hypothetical protein
VFFGTDAGIAQACIDDVFGAQALGNGKLFVRHVSGCYPETYGLGIVIGHVAKPANTDDSQSLAEHST